MKRKIFSLMLVISCFAIFLMAVAFYQLNKSMALTGLDQYFRADSSAEQIADVMPPDGPISSVNETPGAVTATFVGTSTLLFTDGQNAIMVDGFFTRPAMGTLLFGTLEPDVELIKASLKRLKINRLDAVAVVHSHHDHAMDAPEVAKQTGAVVFGSQSTANIALGAGLLDSQIAVVKDQRTLQFGAFKVSMLKSSHTPVPAAMAWLTGIGEEISEPLQSPARLADYKEGGSYVIYIEHPRGNIVVQASGGYTEGLLASYTADTVFLGVAGLSKQSDQFKADYYREVVKAVKAKRVIPIHWDDFMRPVEPALVPFHPIVDDVADSLVDLSRRIYADKNRTLIMMQAWESIKL